MPRTYRRKLGARQYRNYSEEVLSQAIVDVLNGKLSVRQAATQYKIPRKTLGNKIAQKHNKKPGGQTVFSVPEEKVILQHILTCADWGMPLDSLDIRLIVKDYFRPLGGL